MSTIPHNNCQQMLFPGCLCMCSIYKATKRQYTHCSQDRKRALLEQEGYNTRYHPCYQPVDQRESCHSGDKKNYFQWISILKTSLVFSLNNGFSFMYPFKFYCSSTIQIWLLISSLKSSKKIAYGHHMKEDPRNCLKLTYLNILYWLKY